MVLSRFCFLATDQRPIVSLGLHQCPTIWTRTNKLLEMVQCLVFPVLLPAFVKQSHRLLEMPVVGNSSTRHSVVRPFGRVDRMGYRLADRFLEGMALVTCSMERL